MNFSQLFQAWISTCVWFRLEFRHIDQCKIRIFEFSATIKSLQYILRYLRDEEDLLQVLFMSSCISSSVSILLKIESSSIIPSSGLPPSPLLLPMNAEILSGSFFISISCKGSPCLLPSNLVPLTKKLHVSFPVNTINYQVDLGKKNEIWLYYSWKEDPKISRIATFGGEML